MQSDAVLCRVGGNPVKAFCLSALVAWLIMSAPGLEAIPVEIGISGVGSQRNPGTFDQGLDNYRTSLNPLVFSLTKHSDFRSIPASEGYIRLGDLISEESYIGLLYGRLYTPPISVRQFRSDAVYFQSNWNFFVHYFGFTYHYRFRPISSSRISYEVGGAYTFVAEPTWRTDGYYLSPFQFSRLQTSHRAGYGSMLRLEGAVVRGLGDHFFVCAGIAQSYCYMGRYQGNVNSTGGYWVTLRNGGFLALAPSQFISTFVVSPDPILGPTQVSTIRDRADINFSLTQFFVSAGLRF